MVTPTCVLVVDAAASVDRQKELWSTLRDTSDVQSVLDVLTRGGISSTPAFALTSLPARIGEVAVSVPLFVRGSLAVTVGTAGETITVSGEGVSTWVERVIPDVNSLDFGTRPRAGAAQGIAPEFVLNCGTAGIAWLSIGAPVESVASSAPVEAQHKEVLPRSPMIAATPEPPDAALAADPGLTITDPTFATPPVQDEPDGGYDFLFGETVMRTVEGAAVRDEPTVSVAGDHDGHTAVGLSAEERRAARQARRGAPAPVAQRFTLHFATGEREVLDRTLVIGRAPSASKVSAASVPRLVTVDGPDQDISRNHVQVSVEGGTVLVTDLHSRNGTLVTLPGRPPQQLRGGHPTAVLNGSLVDLGSGVSFTVSES
jgi:hypothetical protein